VPPPLALVAKQFRSLFLASRSMKQATATRRGPYAPTTLLVNWPVLTLRVKKTTYVIFMCNNKCARVNATYKFQTYKAITLFQAKLLLHNHIHPPRSIRICSLRLPRALESPTATTCRIPQLQVSSKTIYNHLPSNRPQRQNKGCIF